MSERTLGMQWLSSPGPATRVLPLATNTRTSLWAKRWPAIAKQECIDQVESVPPEFQSQVKFDLPCHVCELASQCLNAKRKELGSLLFDREILTNPRSAESSLFPRDELMAPMLNPALSCLRSYRKPNGSKGQLAVAQAWDIAWSERTGGDYLVCMTALVDLKRGQRRLLNIERWQRVSFDNQCQLIQQKWRQYDADVVVIESDAAQSIWTQHMAATTPVPVVPHDAGGKRDLAHGVPSMSIEFENRKWEFPFREGQYGYDEVDNLLVELEAFGWVDGKLQGVGEHDDTVMCLWHLAWVIKSMLLGTAVETFNAVVPGRTM